MEGPDLHNVYSMFPVNASCDQHGTNRNLYARLRRRKPDIVRLPEPDEEESESKIFIDDEGHSHINCVA